MFDGKTTPEEIIRLVYEKIDECGGLYKAFLVSETGDPYSGCTLLYSGPNREFFEDEAGKPKKIIGAYVKNEARALAQLTEKAPPAAIINLSAIGRYLFVENDLYEWLNEQHKNPISGKIDYEAADEEITQVMTEVSALFIRTVHGAVETACCGAVRGRVFCATELRGACDRDNIPFAFPTEAKVLIDALCANDDITTINGVKIDRYRALHDKGDYEGVYDLICRSELRSRLYHAIKTKDETVFADYLDRKELYEYDQIHLGKVDAAHPLYQKHMRPEAERLAEKEALIAKFKAKYAPAPTAPAPRGARPAAAPHVPH
jgi:hypothetical protein